MRVASHNLLACALEVGEVGLLLLTFLLQLFQRRLQEFALSLQVLDGGLLWKEVGNRAPETLEFGFGFRCFVLEVLQLRVAPRNLLACAFGIRLGVVPLGLRGQALLLGFVQRRLGVGDRFLEVGSALLERGDVTVDAIQFGLFGVEFGFVVVQPLLPRFCVADGLPRLGEFVTQIFLFGRNLRIFVLGGLDAVVQPVELNGLAVMGQPVEEHEEGADDDAHQRNGREANPGNEGKGGDEFHGVSLPYFASGAVALLPFRASSSALALS